MGQDRNFPWGPVAIFTAFGLLCFFVGFLTSNIANKKAVRAFKAELFECENKSLLLSRDIISNANLALDLTGEVSSVWQKSVLAKSDFNAKLAEYQDSQKSAFADLKIKNERIDAKVSEMKKSVKQQLGEFEAAIELYDIYKKIFDLGVSPIGTYEGFKRERELFLAKYNRVRAQTFVYMPLLRDMFETDRLSEEDAVQTAQKPKISEQIKKVSKDMTYRQIESLLGVPRDKMKDSTGNEVWVYISEKGGGRNCVYFAQNKVLQIKNLPAGDKLE